MKTSNWVLLAALYISQFLPVAFFFMGLPAILRDRGMALEQIGVLYSLGLIWVLKFLWAPVLDRRGWGRLGDYRGWMLIAQAGIAAMLVAISQLDPARDFGMMVILAIAMTAMAATQDIAADATACRLLPPESRGLGNAMQTAGGVLGLILGGGGMIFVYARLGWQSSVLVMALVMVLVMIPVLIYREPLRQAPVSARPGMGRLVGLWREPGMGLWAVTLVVLNLGVSIVFPLLQTGLVDAGWPVDRVGLMLNVLAPLVSLLAVAGTGALLRRMEPMRLITIVLPLEAVAALCLLPMARGDGTGALVLPAIFLLYLAHHSVLTAVTTEIMGRTARGTEGSDFTVQHSLYLLTGFVSGGMALQLAGRFGYGAALMVAAGVILFATVFAALGRGRSRAAAALVGDGGHVR